MHRELSTLTLRIVTQGVFGSQLPSDISSDEVYNSTDTALKVVIGTILSGRFLIPGYRSLPTKANRASQRSIETLKSMVAKIIRQRRQDMQEQGEGESGPAQDLLSL